MKVTQLKEMIYNPQGQLEQMKYTQSMKRIVSSSQPMLKSQNLLPITNTQSHLPIQEDDDAKSMASHFSRKSMISRQSNNSRLSDKDLDERKSINSRSSNPSVFYYESEKEGKFNWKLCLFAVVFVLGLYLFLADNEDGPDRSSKQIAINRIQQSLDSDSKCSKSLAENLVGRYLDQLLTSNGYSMLLSQFRQKMTRAENNISNQEWEQFLVLLRQNQGIKISIKNGQEIGSLDL